MPLFVPSASGDVSILDQQIIPVTVTGTLVETDLYNFTIPAGTLQIGSQLFIRSYFVATGSGGTKLFSIRYNGTLVDAGGQSTAGTRVFEYKHYQIDGVTSSVDRNYYTFFAVNPISFDTSINTTLQITMTLADIADSVTLGPVALILYK